MYENVSEIEHKTPQVSVGERVVFTDALGRCVRGEVQRVDGTGHYVIRADNGREGAAHVSEVERETTARTTVAVTGAYAWPVVNAIQDALLRKGYAVRRPVQNDRGDGTDAVLEAWTP